MRGSDLRDDGAEGHEQVVDDRGVGGGRAATGVDADPGDLYDLVDDGPDVEVHAIR